jgi:hypothetical protein
VSAVVPNVPPCVCVREAGRGAILYLLLSCYNGWKENHKSGQRAAGCCWLLSAASPPPLYFKPIWPSATANNGFVGKGGKAAGNPTMLAVGEGRWKELLKQMTLTPSYITLSMRCSR